MWWSVSFLLLVPHPQGTLSTPVSKRQADQWGPWGDWAACSRSCGGGITHRERPCLYLRDDGQPECFGSTRMYRTCNVQACPEGSRPFRNVQCSEFDEVPFEGRTYKWVPYHGGTKRCELNCMPKGENFYFRHALAVIDGTPCELGKSDKCVEGICMRVGCDGELESDRAEDKCRVCGGDGRTCYPVSGVFTKSQLPIGYSHVVLVPAGATSILIKEMIPSRNFLAVRTLRGEYHLNGDWTVDYSQTFTAAGTTVEYDRSEGSHRSAQSVHASGPTTEPLLVELISQEENKGIHYEYFMPAKRNRAQLGYGWSHGSWGSCGKECSGGFQTRTVYCSSDNEVLPDAYCAGDIRPASNRSCNTDPCPAVIRWRVGDWGSCSVTCGAGEQTRPVRCMSSGRNGSVGGQDGRVPSSAAATAAAPADESACLASLGPAPASRQSCSLQPCPQWIIGSWEPCSAECGQGRQQRQVLCGSGDGGCEQQGAPPSERECNLGPCRNPEWSVSPWSECSATCGTGVQTRAVTCGPPAPRGAQLARCSPASTPPARQPCERAACPARSFGWFEGPWGLCSVSCGGGLRKRQALCYNEDFEVMDPRMCGEEGHPTEEEGCNTQPCYLPQEVPSQPNPLGFDSTQHRVYSLQGGEPAWGQSERVDQRPERVDQRPERVDQRPERVDQRPERVDQRPERVDQRPERVDQRPERVDQRPERVDQRPERVDQRPERVDQRPERVDCAGSYYGCCPDGRNPAHGHRGEGCPDVSCYQTRFGCCPDGVNAARGTDALGCPSGYDGGEEHGPEEEPAGRQEAHGREPERPREPAVAAGQPAERAAHPPVADDCHGQRFGCCPDHVSPAQGPNGEGCSGIHDGARPACSLPSARGACADYAALWYWVPANGACNRFWYSGCDGNVNRFDSEEACVRACAAQTAERQQEPRRAQSAATHRHRHHQAQIQQEEHSFETHHREAEHKPQPDSGDRPSQPVYSLWIERDDPTAVERPLGHATELLCRAQGSPGVALEWMKDSRAIDPSRYVVLLNGSLYIQAVEEEDAGIYTCRASNGQQQEFRQVQLSIMATTSSAEKPPVREADNSAAVVEARAGSSVRLPCRYAASEPAPRPVWRDGSGRAPTGRRFRQLADGSLVISAVVPGDAGTYACELETRLGAARRRSSLTLKVKGVLSIVKPPGDVEVEEGDEATFPCTVSDKKANVIWTRNGVSLTSGEVGGGRVLVSGDGMLVLRNVHSSDAGRYTCNAYSGSRSVSASAHLTVQDTSASVPRGDGGGGIVNGASFGDAGGGDTRDAGGGAAIDASAGLLGTASTASERSCIDRPELANCELVVQASLCHNAYYTRFCCASCTAHAPSRRATRQRAMRSGAA
uniref:Papilin-like isoform X2 n=1 Tax=Petromyzon marinus TaxID=7757 RepID=A0AAJ7T7R2_PETMA|nr:papilin-like isoform X2 [Petromyzon marinus]